MTLSGGTPNFLDHPRRGRSACLSWCRTIMTQSFTSCIRSLVGRTRWWVLAPALAGLPGRRVAIRSFGFENPPCSRHGKSNAVHGLCARAENCGMRVRRADRAGAPCRPGYIVGGGKGSSPTCRRRSPSGSADPPPFMSRQELPQHVARSHRRAFEFAARRICARAAGQRVIGAGRCSPNRRPGRRGRPFLGRAGRGRSGAWGAEFVEPLLRALGLACGHDRNVVSSASPLANVESPLNRGDTAIFGRLQRKPRFGRDPESAPAAFEHEIHERLPQPAQNHTSAPHDGRRW